MGTPLTVTRFGGDIQSGTTTGNQVTHTRASSRVSRWATVSAASSANIMLPGDATNMQFILYVTTPTSGTNAADIKIGNVNDQLHFARFSASAIGMYMIPNAVSAQSLITPVGFDNVMTVIGSAIGTEPNFLGRLCVIFSRGPGGNG